MKKKEFKVIRLTDEQIKRRGDDIYYPILCFVFITDENFLPDWTPDWLFDIINNVPGEISEYMESTYAMTEKSYEYLINHPQCKEYRFATKEEAYIGYCDDYDSNEEENDLNTEEEAYIGYCDDYDSNEEENDLNTEEEAYIGYCDDYDSNEEENDLNTEEENNLDTEEENDKDIKEINNNENDKNIENHIIYKVNIDNTVEARFVENKEENHIDILVVLFKCSNCMNNIFFLNEKEFVIKMSFIEQDMKFFGEFFKENIVIQYVMKLYEIFNKDKTEYKQYYYKFVKFLSNYSN